MDPAAMVQAAQMEILDLRHFSAANLKPLLAAESHAWSQRLHWDYRTSADLIAQYLDSRALPGFVAVEGNRVLGYVFCVYEDAKAVIGDVFAVDGSDSRLPAAEIERQLLEHLIEMLEHSPGVVRIEAQLLLHPAGSLSSTFRSNGFELFRRVFMERSLAGTHLPQLAPVPAGFTVRAWLDEDFNPAAHLIAEAYADHLDSSINDQYQTVAGSLRFLHNIVRFPGCGIFDSAASRVLVVDATREVAGVLLCSRVRSDVGHVTQICISPRYRRHGFGAHLLQDCSRHLQQRGFQAITLTVTEANSEAVRLYERIGFARIHAFEAMLWTRAPYSAG